MPRMTPEQKSARARATQIAKRFRSWAAWVSEHNLWSSVEGKQLLAYLMRHATLWEQYADIARTNPEKIPPPNKLTKGFKGTEFY